MKTFLNHLAILIIALTIPACEIVGGIFKAGMVWGILLVVGIVALIVFLISKAGKK